MANDESSTRATSRTNSTRARTSWQPAEIEAQILLTEKQPVSAGHVHWNMKSLLRSAELQTALTHGPYAEPALIPAFRWLDSSSPAKVSLVAVTGEASVKLSWTGQEKISSWLLQLKRGEKWITHILPADVHSNLVKGALPDVIALSAVDRVGNQGPPAVLALQK